MGGDDDPGSIAAPANRKPVVPYHGEIDAKHLTHKQKRMMQKRDKKDRVVKGPAKKELRSAIEIQKEKKKRDANKAKQNPHLRRAKAHEAKAVRMKRLEERQLQHTARTKSRMLVFEGPKKSRVKKGGKRGFL